LRIAWFTPLSKRTGIAKYSLAAIKALSEKAQIDIWTNYREDNFEITDFAVNEAIVNEENVAKLAKYDAVIYNIGNNIEYHCEIFEFYKKLKGIVILHDRIMHHFFVDYVLAKHKSPQVYMNIIDYYYGTDGKKAAARSFNKGPRIWETEEYVKYPLFEFFLWNALGLIVHSQDTLKKIPARFNFLPSICLDPPFDPQEIHSIAAPFLTRESLGIPKDKITLLSHGSFGKMRRIEKVFEVIKHNPQIRKNVYYVIAGDSGYAANLKKSIAGFGLENEVKLTGFVDDRMLYSLIKNADVCINLRFPSTESSSWSLLEQMALEKPVIVTKTAFYKELPDDAVVKIGMEDETKNIAEALNFLIADQDFRKKIANNALRYVEETYGPAKYAGNFLAFLDSIQTKDVFLDFVDDVTDELSRFGVPELNKRLVDDIARETSAFSIN